MKLLSTLACLLLLPLFAQAQCPSIVSQFSSVRSVQTVPSCQSFQTFQAVPVQTFSFNAGFNAGFNGAFSNTTIVGAPSIVSANVFLPSAVAGSAIVVNRFVPSRTIVVNRNVIRRGNARVVVRANRQVIRQRTVVRSK